MLLLEELRIQMWFGHNITKYAVCREETMEHAKMYVYILKNIIERWILSPVRIQLR